MGMLLLILSEEGKKAPECLWGGDISEKAGIEDICRGLQMTTLFLWEVLRVFFSNCPLGALCRAFAVIRKTSSSCTRVAALPVVPASKRQGEVVHPQIWMVQSDSARASPALSSRSGTTLVIPMWD